VPVFGILLLQSGCASLRQPAAIDRLQPCRAADGPTDGYCGTLEVWEDRQTKTGRKIALKIMVLPALKQKYASDPLFFLAGGPGQGAAELARDLREPFHRIQADRDIVFVDQRGTGKSNPLECKDTGNEEKEEDSSTRLAARLHNCLESYRDKADVTKYATDTAIDDLDDVRGFLGYSTINLYGGSYGTRAAMVYARRHRANTRAVILDGVAPTDMKLPVYMARDSQHALDLLFQDCEKDAGCAQRFPNLRGRLETVLARLSAHPQRIHYVHPRTGVESDLDVKRLTVTSVLFASLYAPLTAELVPLLIEQAEKGNYTGFLALQSAYDPLSENMALGMQFSVLCSEDATQIDRGSLARETAGTFLGAELAELRLKPCEFWPRAQMEPAYFETPPSDVPALILSGALDPVTPQSWGQEVAGKWKNSRHVVVPGTGHGTWPAGCVMKLMAQFLNDGSAEKLDTSCVEQVKRPPFFLSPSGPDPKGGGR